MAVIAVRSERPESIWRVARWAFVWLLRQAMAQCQRDGAIHFVFEQAIALDGLHFALLNPEQARIVGEVLISVSSRAAAGELPVEVDGRVLGSDDQLQFQNAARELLLMLTSREPVPTSGPS